MTLSGSCNSLLCVTINGFGNDQFTYIWNPATKYSMLLPQPTIQHEYDRDMVDLSTGFGFDPISNDYKVVRILKFSSAEVYSSNNSCWRGIDNPPEDFPIFAVADVCVKGILYWVSEIGMLAFDLNEEVFSEHLIPENVLQTIGPEYDLCITDYEESVALIIQSKGEESNVVSLWVVDDLFLHGNDNGELGAWNRKFSFEIESTAELVYGYVMNGFLIVKAHEEMWYLYNPEKNEEVTLPIPLDTRGIFRHTGSLTSVPGSEKAQWKAAFSRRDQDSMFVFL